MSCECIKDIKKKILDNQPIKGLKVTDVEIPTAFVLIDNTMIAIPYLDMELTVEGRKRPVKHSLYFNFCPFCGKAYDETQNQEVQP